MTQIERDATQGNLDKAFDLAENPQALEVIEAASWYVDARFADSIDDEFIAWKRSLRSSVARLLNNVEKHYKDADCVVDSETNLCIICGVEHDTPCPDCGNRAFHSDVCSMLDGEQR